jgi:hypothetical protein
MENFRSGGVKIFHKMLQQICENLKGWPKDFKNMPFLGVGVCVKAKQPPTPLPLPFWNNVCL